MWDPAYHGVIYGKNGPIEQIPKGKREENTRLAVDIWKMHELPAWLRALCTVLLHSAELVFPAGASAVNRIDTHHAQEWKIFSSPRTGLDKLTAGQ